VAIRVFYWFYWFYGVSGMSTSTSASDTTTKQLRALRRMLPAGMIQKQLHQPPPPRHSRSTTTPSPPEHGPSLSQAIPSRARRRHVNPGTYLNRRPGGFWWGTISNTCRFFWSLGFGCQGITYLLARFPVIWTCLSTLPANQTSQIGRVPARTTLILVPGSTVSQ
jgi:hypothetical protein